MMEQDKEVIEAGDSETQELGDKITFYPKSTFHKVRVEE